nr:immunoglobulin light chain junction region [Macaca mulatta]
DYYGCSYTTSNNWVF